MHPEMSDGIIYENKSCFVLFRLLAFSLLINQGKVMFIKKAANWKVWKRICIPLVIISFPCLLLHAHYRERDRIEELSKALAEAAALSDTPIKLELSNLEDFQATAYCITGITKSGLPVAPGHVAADPRVIPLGSMIYVESTHMGGFYQVTDTGRLIKGKIIDIFIPSYKKSREFGRRKVKVKVLRYGYGDDRTLSHHPDSFLSIVPDNESQ